MIRSLKRRLTYANVMATIACIIAMSGTAWAAATIGTANVIDDSLRSRDIKDGTLAARDLGPASVAASELASGSVTSEHIADEMISAADLSSEVNDAIVGVGRASAWATVRFQAPEYVPQLVVSRTHLISAVRRSGGTPGYYCLTSAQGVDFSTHPALATPDYGLSAGDQFRAYVDSTANECSAGELAVVTNTDTGAGRSTVAFTVVVF